VGQAQSGLPDFRFGNLAEDLRLVERARDLAAELLRRENAARK
jgi:RecG-like helicase